MLIFLSYCLLNCVPGNKGMEGLMLSRVCLDLWDRAEKVGGMTVRE